MVTINEILDDYKNVYMVKERLKSANTVDSNIRALKSILGIFEIQHLRVIHIDRYIAERRKFVKDGTIRREMALLMKSINLARKKYKKIRKIDPETGNYSEEWKQSNEILEAIREENTNSEKSKRTQIPNDEQLEAIMKHCNQELYDITFAASRLAYRKSELLNLRWCDIDFERKEIILNDHKTMAKTGHGRTTPLYKEIYNFLLKLKRKAQAKHGEDVSYLNVFTIPIKPPYSSNTNFGSLKASSGSAHVQSLSPSV